MPVFGLVCVNEDFIIIIQPRQSRSETDFEQQAQMKLYFCAWLWALYFPRPANILEPRLQPSVESALAEGNIPVTTHKKCVDLR